MVQRMALVDAEGIVRNLIVVADDGGDYQPPEGFTLRPIEPDDEIVFEDEAGEP